MVINLDNIKYIFQIPLQWYKKVHNACFKSYGEDYVKIDATDDGTNIISLDTERLDETIEEKIDEKISELGEVKSVDGHTPDESGDVSFGLDANKYVITDSDGHLSTTDALSVVQSIKIQGQSETFNPDSNGLATLTIKHSGISDWGDATGNFVTPQAVESQIQSHNFATQQGLNQLGTTVTGVIGRVDEHEGRIEALEEWQVDEVEKDAETKSAIDSLKTTTQTQTSDISGLKNRLADAEDAIDELDGYVAEAYSPSNPPTHSDISDWSDATKNFCKYNNGNDTTTTGIAQFKNDTVSYLGRSDTKQAFVTVKGKAVSLIAQNGFPYRTDGEDDIKWSPDFVKLAKDQSRARIVCVNREGTWSSLMNTNTTSQGIPFLGKEGGAGSSSSTLNVLTKSSAISADSLVAINKSGNVTTIAKKSGSSGAILACDGEGSVYFSHPQGQNEKRDNLVAFQFGEPVYIAPQNPTKDQYVMFKNGLITLSENPIEWSGVGFVNVSGMYEKTITYHKFGTGNDDIARGDHHHNTTGTPVDGFVDCVTDVTWNGTQIVVSKSRLTFSNGIFISKTPLVDSTINTVTYNPS